MRRHLLFSQQIDMSRLASSSSTSIAAQLSLSLPFTGCFLSSPPFIPSTTNGKLEIYQRLSQIPVFVYRILVSIWSKSYPLSQIRIQCVSKRICRISYLTSTRYGISDLNHVSILHRCQSTSCISPSSFQS